MENNKTVNSLNKSSSILRILGLVLVLASFVLFIYNTRKQESRIQSKNTEIIKKDSILTTIKTHVSREDSLKSIVIRYFKLRALHDADALDTFFSDTVTTYFKNLKNCTKEEIRLSDKQYWAKYRNDAFYVKSEPEITLNGNAARAIIQGKQCRTENNCMEVIVEIKFDSNNKITFVREYFAK